MQGSCRGLQSLRLRRRGWLDIECFGVRCMRASLPRARCNLVDYPFFPLLFAFEQRNVPDRIVVLIDYDSSRQLRKDL